MKSRKKECGGGWGARRAKARLWHDVSPAFWLARIARALRANQSWGTLRAPQTPRIRFSLAIGVIGCLVAPQASAAPPACAEFVIAIDVGHDSVSGGATSARGVAENVFNTRLASRIVTRLTAGGFKVHPTNPDNKPVPLAERPARAAAAGAGLFLSIHHDSVQPRYLRAWGDGGKPRRYSDHFAGYSLFVSANNPQYEDSLVFARHLGDGLRGRGFAWSAHHAEPIDGENRPLVDADRGVYRYDGLAVLRRAKMPAVLIEAGIIVNRDEEKRLADPRTQDLIADAVVDAVGASCRGGSGP